MNPDVLLDGDRLRIREAAPTAVGAARERVVPATSVRDTDPDAFPPEIRTVEGETLFVPADRRGELERFCAVNRIPRRPRPDVWGDLLEPFSDTGFTAEHQGATLTRLRRAAGLDADDVAAIRARVGPLVRAYNAVHQDWCHLGLADLLDAATADWIPEGLRVAPADRAAFRTWAMRIADLGHGLSGGGAAAHPST